MMKFTDQAIEFFSQQAIAQKKKYWVVSMKKVGCSGYQYYVQWRDEPLGEPTSMGLWSVCVDPLWEHIIKHVTVDIQQDRLGQKKVVYENNMTSTHCGCGESFMILEKS